VLVAVGADYVVAPAQRGLQELLEGAQARGPRFWSGSGCKQRPLDRSATRPLSTVQKQGQRRQLGPEAPCPPPGALFRQESPAQVGALQRTDAGEVLLPSYRRLKLTVWPPPGSAGARQLGPARRARLIGRGTGATFSRGKQSTAPPRGAGRAGQSKLHAVNRPPPPGIARQPKRRACPPSWPKQRPTPAAEQLPRSPPLRVSANSRPRIQSVSPPKRPTVAHNNISGWPPAR